MNRKLTFLMLIGMMLLLIGGAATANDKEGPMTGTWTCQAHGTSEGDMTFTLYLQQDEEKVDGSVSSPIGSTQITSGTFKNGTLEIHIDTDEDSYVLTAKFDKGALSGTWAHGSEKGAWEGKKEAAGSH